MAASDSALCRQWEAEAEEAEDSDMRCLKLARTEPRMIAPGKVAPFFIPGSNSIFPDAGQMLSFSSTSKQEAMVSTVDGTLPYYRHLSASASTPSYLRNAGLNPETWGKNMQRVLGRVRGPFTPSQWLELERQAMIYKYMDANVAIPPSLLIRGFGSCAFHPSSSGYFGSSSLGWGQGFSGNEDPEPGRCRRTDGKKWRCSRDAVADQKYCERHMNRGRHRSRKHVEGHIGHAAKVMPAIVPSQSASTVSAAGFSINVTKSLLQTQSFQTTHHYPEQMDRMKTREGNVEEGKKESEGQCMLGSLNATPSSDLLQAPKEQNPFEEASLGVQLGLVSMNFPMRPPSCSLLQQIEPRHLQNFSDEFYKNQFVCSNTPWSGIEEVHSITMSCSDCVSSTFTCDGLRSFPFKSSKEFNTVDVSLGVGLSSEGSQHQSGWIPGPLGEVLNNTSATTNEQCNNFLSSSMHLLTEGCDLNKWAEVSPNAALQKAPFQSVPSSTMSSPRTEENHNGSISDDILGSALVNLPTIPS